MFPVEIIKLINNYAEEYKLGDWLLDKKIKYYWLSENPHDGALNLLLKTKNKIDWGYFSANSNDRALDLLLEPENKKKICWNMLNTNKNDRAIDLLKKNKDKFAIDYLLRNPNDRIVKQILKNEPHKYIRVLSSNPNDMIVTELLKKENRKLIYWPLFTRNSNDKAVDLIMTKSTSFNFHSSTLPVAYINLSANSNERVINYLINNPKIIDWNLIWKNPGIFEVDQKRKQVVYKILFEI